MQNYIKASNFFHPNIRIIPEFIINLIISNSKSLIAFFTGFVKNEKNHS